MAQAALERGGVWDLFDVTLTCSEVGQGKHDPAIFEEALRRLGTSRESTWVFEDSLYAVRTAKAAGFPVRWWRTSAPKKTGLSSKPSSDQYLVRYSDFRWEDTL